jgi:glutamate--cysteine ligase
MHFVPLADAQPFAGSCNLPDCKAPPGGSHLNRFYSYGVVARLAQLAAAIELARTSHLLPPRTTTPEPALAG